MLALAELKAAQTKPQADWATDLPTDLPGEIGALFTNFFGGEGFPTKIGYGKQGTLIRTSLLEDLETIFPSNTFFPKRSLGGLVFSHSIKPPFSRQTHFGFRLESIVFEAEKKLAVQKLWFFPNKLR